MFLVVQHVGLQPRKDMAIGGGCVASFACVSGRLMNEMGAEKRRSRRNPAVVGGNLSPASLTRAGQPSPDDAHFCLAL